MHTDTQRHSNCSGHGFKCLTTHLWPSSFWQNTQHRKQHAVFLSKKRKYKWRAWNNCSCYFTSKSFTDSKNKIKIGHRLFFFITFRNHRHKILMLFHIYKSRRFRKSNQKRAPELGIPAEWQHSKVSRRNVTQTRKTLKAVKINQMLYSFSQLSGIIGKKF